jgi:hypothetical protein
MTPTSTASITNNTTGSIKMNHALIISVSHTEIIRNMGAYKIASWLRDTQGWDVEVIDWGGFWTLEELQEMINKRCSDKTVFIGFSDPWGPDSVVPEAYVKYNSIITYAKNKWPKIKTITGSPDISFSVLKTDYYIQGYAEYAILEVIKHIMGTNTEKLKYTLWGGGKLVNALDYPAYYMDDLFIRYEKRDFLDPIEQVGMELSRGCKFECDYCNYGPLGLKGDNFRAVDNYIDNLKYMYDEWGINTFFFADSTANTNLEKLHLMAEGTAKLNWKPWICGFTRIEILLAHPNTWDSMIAMGYVGHHYGIESFTHKSAKLIGKGLHPDKVKAGLIKVKDYFKPRSNYRSVMTFIAGLPYESLESHLDGLKWVDINMPDEVYRTYPLSIPNPRYSGHMRNSLFSGSYEKYGYVDLNTGPPKTHIDWYNKESGLSLEGLVKFFTKWQDEQEAQKTHPWGVGPVRQTHGVTDIAEVLDLQFQFKFITDWEEVYKFGRPFVKKYIEKKLNSD